MNEEIINFLSEAGWFEGRKIDISYVKDDLQGELLTQPNSLIYQFLEEYGNLGINYTTKNGIFGYISTNPDRGIQLIDKPLLNKFERVAKEKLVPVGSAYFDAAIFLMSYTGKFYVGGARVLVFVGNTFFETLEIMINQAQLTAYPL
jgi:hypothetical protein